MKQINDYQTFNTLNILIDMNINAEKTEGHSLNSFIGFCYLPLNLSDLVKNTFEIQQPFNERILYTSHKRFQTFVTYFIIVIVIFIHKVHDLCLYC